MHGRLLAASILLTGLATTSFASMITNGTFNIAGEIFVTGGSASPVVTPAGTCPANTQCIFWQSTDNTPVNNRVDISGAGLPSGDIQPTIAGNDAAVIQNETNPPESVGGGGFAAQDFMSFMNGGVTTHLLLNFIPPGIDGNGGCPPPAGPNVAPPAAGQICTPPGSLFNLQNLSASKSTVGWQLQGITNDSTSTWSGTFTSQFNTQNYQQVLQQLATNGFVQNTFSASITLVIPAVAPEPSPLLFVGMGLALVFVGKGFHRRARS